MIKRLNYLRIIIHREEWIRCKNLLAKLDMPLLGKYNPFEDVFSPLVKQPVEEVEILPRQGYAFPSNPKLRKRWTKVKGVTLDEFEQMFCSKESAITNKESELQIALAAKAKLESDIARIRRELWELIAKN